MTDSNPRPPSNSPQKKFPFGEVATVASALGAAGLISARVAAGEFGDTPGMLAFSWSGALVSVGAALGVCSALLKRGSGNGQRGLIQVFGVATIGVAWAFGSAALPSIPRSFGGTAPICQILTLDTSSMAPHKVTALKHKAEKANVIVTAPVQVFASGPRAIHVLEASGRLIRIKHEAIVQRAACSAR